MFLILIKIASTESYFTCGHDTITDHEQKLQILIIPPIDYQVFYGKLDYKVLRLVFCD